ncbi:MAG: restriction endonuclease subunit S [Deltaproteobacteria bacterium]|jgi:type I restriction enzyme S subunit|nr:restriction endonuclease subunit S [Deltaproteobacteria bacterium]
MNIEITRTKILNLAISGKLTSRATNDAYSHFSSDENIINNDIINAKTLLFSLNDEYRENNYNNIPITDNLPRRWKLARLDDIAKITLGISPGKNYFSRDSNGVEFHQGTSYFTDKYLSVSPLYSTKNNKIAEADTLLMSRRAPIALLNITKRRICLGENICSIQPLDNMKTDFLYYWLLAFRPCLTARQKGTALKFITFEDIRTLILPIPTIEEQNIITLSLDYCFSILNEIKNAKINILATTATIKRKILFLAFSGNLILPNAKEKSTFLYLNQKFNFEKFNDGIAKIMKHNDAYYSFHYNDYEFLKRLPTGWSLKRLEEIADIVWGHSPLSSEISKEFLGFEFHQGKRYFTDKYLAKSPLYVNKRSIFAKQNSVILNITNPVGLVNICDRDICVGRNLCAIVPKYAVKPDFLFYWLTFLNDYFVSRAKGSIIKHI